MADPRVVRFGVVVLAGLFVALSGGAGFAARAQQAGIQAGTSSNATEVEKPGTAASNSADANDKKQDVEGLKAAPPMTDKQKKLAADTDRLLALAKELKQQVDKTNKNVLSVTVVKKAEEIEKLARSVKTEMK